MERIEIKYIQPLLDKFYVTFMSIEQYHKIPSLKGIKFYDGEEYDLFKTPYKGFYEKSKLYNIPKDYDEDDEGFFLKEEILLYPDFYIKCVEEMED